MTAIVPESGRLSTWAQLRRRKVVQWGLAYAAGAWALLQVFGFAADTFSWPVITKQLAMLGLAVGLPVVVTLAWYHGDRGQQRVTGLELAVVTLLLFLGGGLLWLYAQRSVPITTTAVGVKEAPTSVATDALPSIAVLPFVNIGANPENEYFSDGLSEELLNRLTMMPNLHVAARTSSFHFKDKSEDVRKIGQLLGVRHVLEGSVRRHGDHVRVTAQLVSAENGYRLWSKTFDRRMADIFAIQDEIALAVADHLKLTLIAGERSTPAHHTTSSPEALDLYLRGRHLYQSWKLERIEQAIRYFDEAIRIDPGFAAAYVSQAEAVYAKSLVACCDAKEALFRTRRDLLRRALDLDPNNADAIAAMAGIGSDYGFPPDFERVERELRRAEAINPNGELVLRNLNWYYMSVGWPPERAIDYARRQFELDPLNPIAALGLAQAYQGAHQYEQSVAAADRAIELDPNYWPGHTFRAGSLLELGRYEDALQSAKRSMELSTEPSERYVDVVHAYAKLGNRAEAQRIFDESARGWRRGERAAALTVIGKYDEALAELEQAYREKDVDVAYALPWKLFVPLHDDPRFQTLVRNFKLERRIQHTKEKSEVLDQVATGG